MLHVYYNHIWPNQVWTKTRDNVPRRVHILTSLGLVLQWKHNISSPKIQTYTAATIWFTCWSLKNIACPPEPAYGRATGFPFDSIKGAVEYSQIGPSPHRTKLFNSLPLLILAICCIIHKGNIRLSSHCCVILLKHSPNGCWMRRTTEIYSMLLFW